MNSISFGRDKTQILKGIALLLMLVHHTSNPSYWSENGMSLYSYFEHQVASTKMCMYIFAFLVGYGFFCSKNKTLKYSLKRILLLIVPFWTILFGIFIPAAYVSGNLTEALMYNEMNPIIGLIYNIFGISETLNYYSWFVCFYILTIFSMPFLHIFYVKSPKWGWLISVIGYYIIECVIHCIPGWTMNLLIHSLFIYTLMIPLAIVGYQCGYWNQEGKLPEWFEGKKKAPLAIFTIVVIMLVNAFRYPVAGFCIQAFYTPLLIFAVVGLFNSFKVRWLSLGLQKVGDLSMYMWFFHAIFFTETVNLYTKFLVMEPIHYYLYTLFVTFVLTYIGSWIVKKLLTPIINRIK